jgi:dTDP-4-dehydrorhamnose reductase
LDLDDEPSSWRLPASVDVAYLCASVTSLQACRADPQGSRRINVDRILALAERLIERAALVVFPSTNLVFDGSAANCHPDHARCPRTEYGRQKAAAERGLLDIGGRLAIVRLSKVLPPGFSLGRQWAAALRRGDSIRPFSDMVMSPVTLPAAVAVLTAIGDRRLTGIFQFSADRDVTYEQAARRLARRLGADPQQIRPQLARDGEPRIEHVPSHTTLDSKRTERECDVPQPRAWESLEWAFEHLEPRPDGSTDHSKKMKL